MWNRTMCVIVIDGPIKIDWIVLVFCVCALALHDFVSALFVSFFLC